MKPRFIALLLMAGLASLALLPWIGNTLERRQLLTQIGAGRQLFIAMQLATLDRKESGDGVAYPAESGIRTTVAYLDLLQQEGYLNANDRAALRPFVVANVSADDPPDTVALVSRDAYDDLQAGRTPRNFTAFQKDGEAVSLPPDGKDAFRLPPRQPAFLEP